jgi:hypothetical protein
VRPRCVTSFLWTSFASQHGLFNIMLAVSSGLALSWTSGMAAPHLTPAMPALSRSVRPAMLDLGSTTQWIADAASGLDPVLLPDTGAAASAAVEAVAEDPGWFDM